VSDLAGLLQLAESLDRLLERQAASPVQEVGVEPVGPQSLEAALAGFDRAAARRVGRNHLADEEDVVAPVLDRLGDELLGRAGTVELGGVDEGHSELDTELQRGDLILASGWVLARRPRSLPQHRNRFAGRELDGAERDSRHCGSKASVSGCSA
jgi:hypothetical protein